MNQIVELNDSSYSAFMEKTTSIVFIDFYSPTCGPCQTLLAYLPKFVEYYEGKDVEIAKVNVSINPKLAKKFMVQSVPLSVVVGKDKMVKRAEVGLLGIDGYFKMIDKELNPKKGFFSKLFGN